MRNAHREFLADRKVDEEFMAGYASRGFTRREDQVGGVACVGANGMRDRRVGVDIEHGDALPVLRRSVGCSHDVLPHGLSMRPPEIPLRDPIWV
jgi:hypothetical protein